MNYSSDRKKAFTVKTGNLDINGNRIKHVTFYKQDENGVYIEYKKARTNGDIFHLSNDEIIKIFGGVKK